VISVSLLSLWAARALTAPLSSFAKAAEEFSLDGAAAPLPERGPEGTLGRGGGHRALT